MPTTRITKKWSFDILPATLNKFLRMHWAIKKKYNDNWYIRSLGECGKPTFEPGKAGSVKSLVDTFTKLGWIRDDDTENLDLTVKEEKSKRKDQRTEVVLIVEVEDAERPGPAADRS